MTFLSKCKIAIFNVLYINFETYYKIMSLDDKSLISEMKFNFDNNLLQNQHIYLRVQ